MWKLTEYSVVVSHGQITDQWKKALEATEIWFLKIMSGGGRIAKKTNKEYSTKANAERYLKALRKINIHCTYNQKGRT